MMKIFQKIDKNNNKRKNIETDERLQLWIKKKPHTVLKI